MSDKKTYIELNGIRYDAHTGEVLEQPRTPLPVHLVAPHQGTIDGFTPHFSHTNVPQEKSRAVLKAPRAVPKSSKRLHASVQKSKTLMRPAVHKPEITPPHTTHKFADIAPVIPREHAARLKRAKTAQKSNFVSRFYTGKSPKVTKRVDSLPVTPRPKIHAHTTVAHESRASAQPASHLSERFEHAIHEATSHLNTHHVKRKKLKRSTVASALLAVVLLGGFFAYQNVPNLQMRVAAARAGFSASLPGYKPAGFGVSGPIKVEPGKVSITFKSRTDDKSFQVRQQVSEWSSSTLLANYAKHKAEVRTYADERGRTLYIYGDSNITWVDGGVWYDVAGNAGLNDDQLLRLANSL